MTPREAFKAGFLLQCADDGLSGAETAASIARAAALLDKQAGVGDWLGSAGNTAMAAGVVAPIAAGAGLGYLAHRAAVPEVDEEDVKKRELIDEFRHFARRARDKQKVKSLRTSTI